MKKLTAILAAAVLLAGCAEDTGNDKADSFSTERCAVTEAYNDTDQLEGKDLEIFKMPDKIVSQSFDKLYRFTINKRTDELYDCEAEGNRIFRKFFGDSFNENDCSKIKDEDGNDVYEYKKDGKQLGFFCAGQVVLYSETMGKEFPPALNDSPCIYVPDKDRDTVLELAGGRFTVGEIADSITQKLNEFIGELFKDYTFYVRSIECIETGSGRYANAYCGIKYHGIPIQTVPSGLFNITYEDGMEMQEFYLFKLITVEASSKDKIELINAAPPYVFYEKKELDTIIPLKGAVGILKKELAKYSNYEFSEISLEYCSKSKKPSVNSETENESEDSAAVSSRLEIVKNIHEEFVPTWCFTVNEDMIIKVDSLTGEITMDTSKKAG